MNVNQKKLQQMIRDQELSITDQDLFLSSAYQKHQTSMAKAATGRYRQGLQTVMEWDESDGSDIAYTDNYRIHLNAANHVTQSFPTRYVLDCKRYYGKDISQFTLMDPMSGSGTSQAVAEHYQVRSLLYDLNPASACGRGNWNALKDEVDDSADLIFFHPPYHDIIKYSGNMWGKPHPDDLSRCENYQDFLEKLNYCIRKFFLTLRKDGRLAVLVGDIRKNGQFYSIQHDLMRMGDFESFIVKGQFNCVSDNRRYQKPFIPVVTEYLLLLKKAYSLIIPFSCRQEGWFSVQNTDIKALTWHHLIRMTMESIGGTAALSDLYERLQSHPKAINNPHYQERIRATIYEHKDQYIPVARGKFCLSYKVA